MIRPLSLVALSVLTLAACDDGETAALDGAPAADAMLDAGALDEGAPLDQGAAPDEGPMADATAPDAGAPPSLAGACPAETRVGRFEVALAADYTSVQGQVADGVVPVQVPAVQAESGACRLLRPPTLFCEGGCAVGEVCTAAGACAPAPGNVDVGAVTVQGLSAAVEMTASAPVWFYSHRGALPHPGVQPGDAVALLAAGLDPVAPFTLHGVGIEPLVAPADPVPLEAGVPTALAWTAGAGVAEVHVELNIANHGGTPAWIECTVPDTGAFTVPVELTDALLALGYSGFPSVVLTRRTADRADTALGCVDFWISAQAVLDLAIPGLVSCSTDADCADDQTCQPDLTCG